MFTVVAFSESQDEAGAMAKMAAVEDRHIKTSGDKITVGNLNQLIGAFAAVGTLGDEARLVSPSLRRVNPYYITPVELGLVPEATPAMLFHPDSPVPLDVNESLEAENDANPAAAEQHTVVVFLADGVQNPAVGAIQTINAHITTALVVGSWEFSEIVFPDSVPVNRDFDIVGARLVCAAGVAFRFVPVGESHRPGGLCVAASGNHDPWFQRMGRLGAWLTFNGVQPPGIEVLGSAAAASATYELYLDVIPR